MRRNLRHWWNFYVLPDENRMLFDLIQRRFGRAVNASRKAFATDGLPLTFDQLLRGSFLMLVFAVRVSQVRDGFRYTLHHNYATIQKFFQCERGSWHQAMMISYFRDVFKGHEGFQPARPDTLAFVLVFASGLPQLLPLREFLYNCTPFHIEQPMDGEPADSKCYDSYERFWTIVKSLFRFI